MNHPLSPVLLLCVAAALSACGPGGVSFTDEDGDGFYADATDPALVDCDDANEFVRPGAREVCDGLDNDCDGDVDENAQDAVEFWPDEDRDGFGVRVDDPVIACEAPEGFSANRRDCNDADPAVFPGAPELCNGRDDNCNQEADEGIDLSAEWFADRDGDGFGGISAGTGCKLQDDWVDNDRDCDDTNPLVNPDADEVCNGRDDNCDDRVDDEEPGVQGGIVQWRDADGDGYGNILIELIACGPGPGRADNPDDCNDADPDLNPDTPWYRDADGDGFGDPAVVFGETRCTPPIGYARDPSDCDDADPTEWTDRSWFIDADADGFGGTTLAGTGCDPDPAWSPVNTDCNDGDGAVNPAADEVCNGGIDDDCDGAADDEDEQGPLDPLVWWVDGDGDGFGVFYGSQTQCAQPEGFADNRRDCNDKDPDLGAPVTWYRDADRDRLGDPAAPCGEGCAPLPGCTDNALDCDDTDFDQRPTTEWYVDNDEDGVGVGTSPVATGCIPDRARRATLPGDCDDDDPALADPFCVGQGFAEVVIEASITAAMGTLTLDCGGVAASLPLSAADDGTSRTLALGGFPAQGVDCTVDASGVTGTASFELVGCGEVLDTVAAGDSATVPLDVRCNGCTDPTAINTDPSVVIETNSASCLYDE